MNYYTIKELREKLLEKIEGLGVNPKFRENPAYSSVISEIENQISQMNMTEKETFQTVHEENGVISFEWTSSIGEKYSMKISCPNPETITSIVVDEKKPSITNNGQTLKEKEIVEKEATLKSGFITLITNGSILDNIDCIRGKCNNTTWSEKKCYNHDGIMTEREYKGYARGELTEDIDYAKTGSALYIPRQAFEFGNMYDKYVNRNLLRRENLDSARFISEDKRKGIKYSAVTPLSQQYGLRNMYLPSGYNSYPKNITIDPLSTEEIEEMIQREKNKKVQEGLRKYAVGRESYYYNSNDDKNFIYEGIEENLEIHK